mmetsp:Transcript_41340/g.95145  ORF Transcript_41340/g.95145 Transcript_41340/m.95145 type:complete len:164 (-) Transcript_41340:90-581(-)
MGCQTSHEVDMRKSGTTKAMKIKETDSVASRSTAASSGGARFVPSAGDSRLVSPGSRATSSLAGSMYPTSTTEEGVDGIQTEVSSCMPPQQLSTAESARTASACAQLDEYLAFVRDEPVMWQCLIYEARYNDPRMQELVQAAPKHELVRLMNDPLSNRARYHL